MTLFLASVIWTLQNYIKSTFDNTPPKLKSVDKYDKLDLQYTMSPDIYVIPHFIVGVYNY